MWSNWGKGMGLWLSEGWVAVICCVSAVMPITGETWHGQ